MRETDVGLSCRDGATCVFTAAAVAMTSEVEVDVDGVGPSESGTGVTGVVGEGGTAMRSFKEAAPSDTWGLAVVGSVNDLASGARANWTPTSIAFKSTRRCSSGGVSLSLAIRRGWAKGCKARRSLKLQTCSSWTGSTVAGQRVSEGECRKLLPALKPDSASCANTTPGIDPCLDSHAAKWGDRNLSARRVSDSCKGSMVISVPVQQPHCGRTARSPGRLHRRGHHTHPAAMRTWGTPDSRPW